MRKSEEVKNKNTSRPKIYEGLDHKYKIHELSDVQTIHIGERTKIWQYTVILPEAKIGSDVNICSHCFIENDVLIGDRVTIKSGISLWDGIEIHDDVFIGPNVVFTNDKFPRSKMYLDKFSRTIIESQASIGAGAILLPGITIGMSCMVGAAAVVTKSVPPYSIVTGNPARVVGYVQNSGSTKIGQTNYCTDNESSDESIKQLKVKDVTLHYFKTAEDMRGKLSVGEFQENIPFIPKRYFLVHDVPSEKVRGEHAHYKCHQFLICVKGNCSVVVDDGQFREEILLNSTNLGVYLPPLTWGVQYKYSKDAVLLVFASHTYDSDDYIRDYKKFIKIVKKC